MPGRPRHDVDPLTQRRPVGKRASSRPYINTVNERIISSVATRRVSPYRMVRRAGGGGPDPGVAGMARSGTGDAGEGGLDLCRRLGATGGSAVTSEALVARDPMLREDRGREGDLASQHRAGADLGELVRLAGAVAAEQLQALALGGEAGAAAEGAHDETGQGDRPVVVAVFEQLRVRDRRV